jgi:hypothetical protein
MDKGCMLHWSPQVRKGRDLTKIRETHSETKIYVLRNINECRLVKVNWRLGPTCRLQLHCKLNSLHHAGVVLGYQHSHSCTRQYEETVRLPRILTPRSRMFPWEADSHSTSRGIARVLQKSKIPQLDISLSQISRVHISCAISLTFIYCSIMLHSYQGLSSVLFS